jgi:hypothetical protein
MPQTQIWRVSLLKLRLLDTRALLSIVFLPAYGERQRKSHRRVVVGGRTLMLAESDMNDKWWHFWVLVSAKVSVSRGSLHAPVRSKMVGSSRFYACHNYRLTSLGS